MQLLEHLLELLPASLYTYRISALRVLKPPMQVPVEEA